MKNLTWRSVLAFGGMLYAFYLLLPNFVHFTSTQWFVPKTKINYGLDIQGGLHLVMGVDVATVLNESSMRLANSLKAELQKENIPVQAVNVINGAEGGGGLIEVQASAADAKRVEDAIAKNHSTFLQLLSNADGKLTYKYFEAYLLELKNRIVSQSIETIRNRIDEFGVAEPSISQQGADRIIIQLPGVADAERAKALINTTAKLDFMIVSREVDQNQLAKWIQDAEAAGKYNMESMKYSEYVQKINEDLKGKLPEKTVVYFEKNDNARTMEAGSVPRLLKVDTGLGGESVDNASIAYDQFGRPQVSLRFNSAGATKFSDITGNNVGQQMAIVLDRVIKSAPNINERIPGGNASISLGTGDYNKALEEAKMISTALNAGALPATLEQLEERTVGPSLGADAIDSAQKAALIGSLLIMIFMIIYYKGMGVVTAVTLMFNVICGLALLSSLGATLTLPGIAGLALTVGFAVDANVLINERIREEIARGVSLRGAIEEGYSKAMSAIIDSNVTTGATAIVLLYFGTGPVRGFAVTLLIGIVTTLFSNVFVSKVLVDTVVHRFNLKKISV